MLKSLIILCCAAILTGCMKVSTFTEEMEINAPADVVFDIITDYESYDELLPELHDTIEIVSEIKDGLGVEWESTGTFKGHSFTTIWTITAFEEDRFVEMKDLVDSIGESSFSIKPLNDNKVLYTMYISTKMFPPYEEEFFEIYRREMNIVKNEAESRVKE